MQCSRKVAEQMPQESKFQYLSQGMRMAGNTMYLNNLYIN